MPYRIKRSEDTADAVRRIVSEQTERAAHELSGGNPDLLDAVHNTRKCLKKTRSALRLVRYELGKRTYRRENGWCRDAAHRLAGARDAEAMLETYDKLAKRHPGLEACGILGEVRASLRQRRDRIVEEQQDLAGRAKDLALELGQVPERLGLWHFKHDGFQALKAGLDHSYRRGEKAFQRARTQPGDERFHEWRKRVKDYWYHTRLLRRLWPALTEPRVGELKRLADLLGDDHDLAVLATLLGREADALGPETPLLTALAVQRQAELRAAAVDLGYRLYAPSPGCLVDELAGLWTAWRSG